MAEEIEKILCSQVMDGEVNISESNLEDSNSEFEQCMDLLSAERSEKNYDWNSDIHIPEFASHWLTQSSLDVGQYFQTREFVTAYLEDGSEDAKEAAAASTECINNTLNRRGLNHYLKFVRGKGINNIVGRVYAKCWWEQKTKQGVIGSELGFEEAGVDEYGMPMMIPVENDIIGDVPVIDQFNYDIWDQRNVFTDNSYVYSIQEKQFITFRSEMTLSKLKEKKKANGYFNLDKLSEIKPPHKTKFKSEAADKDDNFDPVISAAEKPYDIYERYGVFWYLKGKKGSNAIGLDNEGKPKDNAELEECIITVAVSNDKRVLIGFKRTPFIDAMGRPYKPVLRGLCYVNLTEDAGVGDGRYSKELQIAIDDTFNVSQDRTMLATLPTLKTKKYALDDNSTIYFEPGHNMEVEDTSDVEEFKISDNITGALQQISMLTDKMQQVDSIQPPQMGDVGMASTTATAFAGAFRATGERTNYKSLTFENTFLCDLYWMIQQMTFRFAKPQTGYALMKDKVYDFDPSREYYYKPVSQSIEPEYSKAAKRKELTTIIGYLAQIATLHPDGVKALNYALFKFFKLFGDENEDIANMLMNQNVPMQEGGVGMTETPQTMAGSNQYLLPASGPELDARGMADIRAF